LGVEWEWLWSRFGRTESENGLFLGWVVLLDGSVGVEVTVTVSGLDEDEDKGAKDKDDSCDGA
jgi:hypothetical protein